MYKYYNLVDLSDRAKDAQTFKEKKDISVYVGSDPDYVDADIVIDFRDKKGLEIFREFAGRMAEHYKSLTQ